MFPMAPFEEDSQAVTAPGAPSAPMAPQAPMVAPPRGQLTPKQVESILALQRMGVEGQDLDTEEGRLEASRKRRTSGDGSIYGSIGGDLGDFFRNLSNSGREEELQQKRAALNAQSMASRKEFFNALQAGGSPDISTLLYSDEASAPQKAQAYAQALRGQQQLAQLAMLSGDPQLQGIAQNLLGGVGKGQEQISSVVDTRQRRADAKEREKVEAEFRRSQETHMAAQDAYQQGLLRQGRFVLSAPTPTSPGYVVDARTGKAQPLLDAPPGRPVDAAKGDKEMNGLLGELSKAINRDAGRGSLLPQAQNRLNASERIKTSIVNPDGTIKDLSPELASEAAINTAALLANGTPGEHTISMLLPKGKSMKAAEIAEWLTDSPHGAGQQKYLQSLVDLAKREEETIGGQIQAAQLRQLPRFAPAFKKYGDTFWNAAQGHIGVDPRTLVDPETLLPLKKAEKGGAPGGGGLSPEKQKRLAELREQDRLEKAQKAAAGKPQ
jgi:hypothetical protein